MEIETNRLTLRVFRAEDAKAYFELSQNEGFRLFQISNYQRSSVDDARAWIENVRDYHRKNQLGIVGVFTLDDSKLIGIGALKYLGQEKESPVELMYRISDQYWGKGYGIEVASALVEYSFNVIKLQTLAATVDPKNVASKMILAKLGFKFASVTKVQGFEEELHELIATAAPGLMM